MNGGILVQNLTGHSIWGTHPIIEISTNNVYEITSTHHQMQFPFKIPSANWTGLFYSPTRSLEYEGLDNNESVYYEPEIVLYHNPKLPKCLAIQGHPEYMRPEAPIIKKLNKLIDELLEQLDK